MGLKTVDLFCGCGGLSLGLKKAGFDIILGVDGSEQVMSVYRKNLEHDNATSDLSDPERTKRFLDLYPPEMIAGGPPCQDYSIANGKRKEGERASLTLEFAEAVVYARPKVFIMENVAPAQKSETYLRANEVFREAGYGLTIVLLDASLCGVPQKRQRLFVIGALDQEDGWLDDTIKSRLAESPMTVREYMGDELGIDYYYRHPRIYARRGVYSLDEPSPTIRGVNREPSSTYKAHPADVADPSEVPVRALTFKERSRIQTFPKEFVWPKGLSKSALEQMVGNAVPVELGRFVGECVMKKLRLKPKSKRPRKKKTAPAPEAEIAEAATSDVVEDLVAVGGLSTGLCDYEVSQHSTTE